MDFMLRETRRLPASDSTPNLDDGWHRQRLSSTEEVPSAIQTVTEAMAGKGYTKYAIFGMTLAMEEALLNAIKHGNQGDPTKQVRVRHRATLERVVVQVEDDGLGFDPDKVPDPLTEENLERPSGRGLLLMRSYMTWIRINRRGNLVTLCKSRSG
jgi:serine/threonine-protein kinase RsbW